MHALALTLALLGPPLGHVEHERYVGWLDPRPAVIRPYRARLLRIARCESGGRWHIATGNGFYGGLQFSLRSWTWVGGRGYPHRSSRREQLYRGVRLMHRQGWGAWPVCQWR